MLAHIIVSGLYGVNLARFHSAFSLRCNQQALGKAASILESL